MNKAAIHYQSIRDGGEMFFGGILSKQGVEPGIGGSNLCIPVLISKKRRPVGLRHRAQKNNIEKQRCDYYLNVRMGFVISLHAVKIRIPCICWFTVHKPRHLGQSEVNTFENKMKNEPAKPSRDLPVNLHIFLG